MGGLDDLIGSLTKKSGGGGSGIEDLLGGVLGGGGSGRSGSGGGLEDLLGGLVGGSKASAGSGGGGGIGTRAGGVSTGALVGALAPLVIGMLRNGGLQKLIQTFQRKGLGAQAGSWVAPGANERVSGSEMRVGLGDDEVRQFAEQAGLPEDEAAEVLAAVVPQVVDGLTPDGRVPSDEELEALLRQVQPE